tara:strand:- start:419 stop:754 length:336 start_codon:yes stop_codon:yes gene_type:complete
VARGLGGLLATGQETKKQATAGLLGAARLEAQKDIAERNLSMQKEAAEQSLMGMGAGVGAYLAADAAIAKAAASKAAGGTLLAQGGAALGALAGPVLLGVAAAALLNKLFD